MSDYDIQENNKIQNIKVYIRMRPLLKYEDEIFWEINKEKNIIFTINCFYSEDINNNSSIKDNSFQNFIFSPKKFIFDKIYPSNYESQFIYQETCQDTIKNLINGINGSIFMYGQTTSGKTFTMLGSPNSPGILPCTLNDIFILINKSLNYNENINYNIYCSYIEIYNEKINDLLNNNSTNLKLIEDKNYGTIVSGTKRVKIKNFQEGIAIKDYGEENRKYRETLINEYSSRSHCIFQIYLEQFHLDENENITKSYYSCLNLIDLAGSERLSDNKKNVKYIGETNYINKSLFMLTNVINKLAENSSSFNKNKYIPYRDSKLTRLLSQSLGGNSITTIICTISPAKINYNQTLSTLNFASRAKCVKLEAKKNEYFDDKDKISYYQNEIKKLKEQLKIGNNNFINEENIYNNLSQNEYNKIINDYKNLSNELNMYKKLYLKEKQKTEKYEANINKNGKNIFFEDIQIENGGSFINDENDDYEKLKNYIINKGNENPKKIQTYDIFKKNKINNNILKSEVEDNIKNENGNIDIGNNFDDNNETINSILKGNVFQMIDINYNELMKENNDIEILKKNYKFKIDSLDKTMDYYNYFLKEYYTMKIKKINDLNDIDEFVKESLKNNVKIRYDSLCNKLISLYKNKKDEIENKFSIFI